MKQAGVRLRIYKSPVIRADGDECSGYFDPQKRVVAVGGKRSEAEFLAILTHEYTHFLQWRAALTGSSSRYAKAWRNSTRAEALGAKGLSYHERYHAYRALLELERQAEVGAMRWLESGGYGTAVERERLRKAAALYLYTHRLMFEKRRWFREGKGDLFEWLEDVNIWNATPSKLRGVDFNRIPPKLKKLLLRLF
jgi:hypothetical protein